nr:protein stay-green 1, chloroplastic-like [Tanacetum cinerariifolium]
MISLIIPTNHNSLSSSFLQKNHEKSIFFANKRRKITIKKQQVPVARLFGPSIFEASKLKVLFLGGVDEQKKKKDNIENEYLPRTYTLTHSDITSKLTLAISQTINNSQLRNRGLVCSSSNKTGVNL